MVIQFYINCHPLGERISKNFPLKGDIVVKDMMAYWIFSLNLHCVEILNALRKNPHLRSYCSSRSIFSPIGIQS